MSNNSVRYNSSVVINNINEWPVDAQLMMTYRLSTWPAGWEEDDTVRFFSDFDSFHRVHASYRDWARNEDNAWRFALYVRESGVSLVLNPDAFIDGASPVTSPVPGSNPDLPATAGFGHLHTVAGAPVGPRDVDSPADGCASDDLLAEIRDMLWDPDHRVTLRKTSLCAFPSFSRSKKVQNTFLDGTVRIFVSDNVCGVKDIPRPASSGGVPFNAIAASPEFAAFVRSTPDEVVFVKRWVCATHVIDVAPVVVDPYSPIGLTLVRPLAWGLALYELDTICALTIDELRDAVVFPDHG